MENLKAKGSQIKEWVDFAGNALIGTFHYLGLFMIGGVVIWASIIELCHVLDMGKPGIENVLTLFIYLELGAMVGVYFKTNHLPIRFIIYIAITAMTRHLIGLITDHGEDFRVIVFYCVGILVLCGSLWLLRYASFKFPSERVIEVKPDGKTVEKVKEDEVKIP